MDRLGSEELQTVLVLDGGVSAPTGGLVNGSNVRLIALDFSPRGTETPTEWGGRLGFEPSELAVVTTDARSVDSFDAEMIQQVRSPADLTGIGVEATKLLDTWGEETAATPCVVLDSLTVLFQYAQLQPLYQFLHALTTRIANVGGYGIAFLDPMTQDQQTVRSIASLFDATAERTDGDDWQIRPR
ncbi:DUF7504 family protein [Haloferax larsenii]|uniref:RecA-superfamily ATPase, KaiC/GvpD/RAD55 family n=1 Tax=Haloferax larsenii TaxID=302484 RepID=A0A1H7L3C1_HALLR|nr:hypothetical protein [Haloferax larsenii]SEK93492.1 hypothetical protein SAMN04488691_102197 [Haloferax larsenii]